MYANSVSIGGIALDEFSEIGDTALDEFSEFGDTALDESAMEN